MKLEIQNGDRDYILKQRREIITNRIIILALAIICVALFIASYNQANALVDCIL